jgi:galactofuranose transport system permease protein
MSLNTALRETGARWIRQAWPLLVLLALALCANRMIAPGFFDISLHDGRLFGGLIDIADRAAPVAILALGMTLVIATRGIDLSVGAVMAIGGAIAAVTINSGAPWMAALGLALGAGLVCGLWNGVLVAVLDIQPIVATLVLMVAGRGIAQLITQGRIVTFDNPALIWFGSGTAAGLPVPIWLAASFLALAVLVTRRTALGLFIESIGINPRASRLAGIHTRGITIAVYAICGFLAGLAGVIAAGDIHGADANNSGLWLELDAILAVVVGGTSLYGGRFSLSLAMVGALTLQAVKTGILRAGFAPQFNLIVMASVVAIVLCVQSPAAQAFFGRLAPIRARVSEP